jgi:hypothetical protein
MLHSTANRHGIGQPYAAFNCEETRDRPVCESVCHESYACTGTRLQPCTLSRPDLEMARMQFGKGFLKHVLATHFGPELDARQESTAQLAVERVALARGGRETACEHSADVGAVALSHGTCGKVVCVRGKGFACERRERGREERGRSERREERGGRREERGERREEGGERREERGGRRKERGSEWFEVIFVRGTGLVCVGAHTRYSV